MIHAIMGMEDDHGAKKRQYRQCSYSDKYKSASDEGRVLPLKEANN